MDGLDLPSTRTPLFVDEPPKSGWRKSTAEQHAKLILTLAIWGSNYLIFSLSAFFEHHDRPGEKAAMRLAVTIFGLALCYGVHRLLRRFSHRSFRTRAIILAVVAPIAAETYAWLNFFAFAWLNSKPMIMVITDWSEALITLSFWTWFFLAWAGLYLALEYSFDVKEEERRSSELRSLAHAAKLQALSNQINPHFLFNSLNAVSGLMLDGRIADAERMLTELSAFFRQTLAIDSAIDIRLADELDLHRRYLAIEQVRYPDLQVEIQLPDALLAAKMPALLLQPIVENAVKHGIAKASPPTGISITATEDRGQLVIAIRDHGVIQETRRPPGGHGIGLANVRERLFEHFGNAQSLSAVPYQNSGFEVTIRMPLAIP